jgi:hypothetical protein
MADVTTYKRATATFIWNSQTIIAGQVRAATDAAVTTNPQWWVALTDAEFTDGKHVSHQQ